MNLYTLKDLIKIRSSIFSVSPYDSANKRQLCYTAQQYQIQQCDVGSLMLTTLHRLETQNGI